MKKILLLCVLAVASITAVAQPSPASWQVEQKDAGNGIIDLVFTATIESPWYMYSVQEMDGPNPTTLSLTKNANFELVGKLTEGIPSKKKFDDAFEIDVQYYKEKAIFIQKIKRLTDNEFTVNGLVEYQTCSDGTCLPGEHSFSIKIAKGAATAAAATAETTTPADNATPAAQQPENTPVVEKATTATTTAADGEQEESFWLFILLAIGAGLGAVLTPCVFPMIPMTVSFFMSGSSSRFATVMKAVIFFFSVGFVYMLIGVIVAIFKSPEIANVISSHYIPNLLFALMFIIFAMSFFGMFEITLPSGLANKADQQADKGGYIASFFMALALAIVSFSCTGPFVGGLLPAAASGTSVLKPILGMFCFGLAMASPFLIVAIFPSLMDKLRSGSWLNSVKVVFAFIMLGFCVKFLTQADLSLGWNIITRDVAVAFWIVLAILLGLYLLGKIKFSHDSDVPFVSVGRLFFAVIAFTFAAYLVPGLFGADLDAVSAFLPAKEKQHFDLTAVQQTAGVAAPVAHKEGTCGGTPKYAETTMHTPVGIKGYFDLQEAMECAKAQNKPILIDFTGHGCANCKKMEKTTFKDQRIIDLMNTEFVWVSLFYDEKTELPVAEQTDDYKTIGKKNLAYQKAEFSSVASPYFAVITPDGNIVVKGLGYSDAEEFLKFANEGLGKFNAGK